MRDNVIVVDEPIVLPPSADPLGCRMWRVMWPVSEQPRLWCTQYYLTKAMADDKADFLRRELRRRLTARS